MIVCKTLKHCLWIAILWIAVVATSCAPAPQRLVVFEAFVNPA
jgi:hypothetical protein